VIGAPGLTVDQAGNHLDMRGLLPFSWVV